MLTSEFAWRIKTNDVGKIRGHGVGVALTAMTNTSKGSATIDNTDEFLRTVRTDAGKPSKSHSRSLASEANLVTVTVVKSGMSTEGLIS